MRASRWSKAKKKRPGRDVVSLKCDGEQRRRASSTKKANQRPKLRVLFSLCSSGHNLPTNVSHPWEKNLWNKMHRNRRLIRPRSGIGLGMVSLVLVVVRQHHAAQASESSSTTTNRMGPSNADNESDFDQMFDLSFSQDGIVDRFPNNNFVDDHHADTTTTTTSSQIPSDLPSQIPSDFPSQIPSDVPSLTPSQVPTDPPLLFIPTWSFWECLLPWKPFLCNYVKDIVKQMTTATLDCIVTTEATMKC